MFSIQIADADVTGGTIPITWCLDIETVKYLSDRKIPDPQVVIVVAPEGDAYHARKEYRKVVPLKDLLAYVEFRASGKNRIWAFISFKSAKEAKNAYLSRESGEYKTDLLGSDGNEWSGIFNYDPVKEKYLPEIGSEPISVEVPAGVFAPEPSAGEKAWVNHFFRDKCVDQCDFRRRRLFAYGVQPFIMLGQLVIRALFLVLALLVGARNTSFAPLLHPLTYDMRAALSVFGGGTIFIRHLPEDEAGEKGPETFWQVVSYIARSFWSFPFMPVIVIVLGVLGYYHRLLFAGQIAGGVLLLALVIGGIVAFFASGSAKDVFNWVCDKIQGTTDGELWYMDQGEIDLLTCNADKKPYNLSTLPAEKRTLRLRFSDLKSKVCRPFSA